MPKPFASARISEALNTAIEKRCKETGKKRSAIITNALEAYLETDAEAPLNLEQQVKALENRVAYLEEHLNQPIQATLFDDKNDNKPDNKSKPNKSKPNKKVIKPDNKSDNYSKKEEPTKNNFKETPSNTPSSKRSKINNKDLEAEGINRKTIAKKYAENQLPYSENGITVHRQLEKQPYKGRKQIVWEISKE